MNDQNSQMIIDLLNQEVGCLRSVLSEFEGDKSHFIQMIRADDFRQAIELLETILK